MDSEQRRSDFKDQIFFEALIYLVERVMKDMFNPKEFIRTHEEINRLFRTNRYNLIKKRHEKDHILKRFPALKDQIIKSTNKNNMAALLQKTFDRTNAFRRYLKERRSLSTHNYTAAMGIPQERAGFDIEQRSPLLCTWLPSRKAMVCEFNTYSSYANSLQAINKAPSIPFVNGRRSYLSSAMDSITVNNIQTH
jgi:hypothetical protein